MPRYFFDVHDGQSMPDSQGTELPDAQAARTEALQVVGNLFSNMTDACWSGDTWSIKVTNADREPVLTVMLQIKTGE